MLPDSRKMNEAPATRRPPSPTRRLNRSKSVFSLAQDFFKMTLNTSSDKPVPDSQDSFAKTGSWNIFGSLRGAWSGVASRANHQRSGRHSASQSLKPLETCRNLTKQKLNKADSSDHEEEAPSLLRYRKSLHNLFGTVGKRSSMKGRRADRTVQPNTLGKRSGAGNNLQIPDSHTIQSIEDADQVHPPQTYPAGSHATIGHRKGTPQDKTVDAVSRPDSGVSVDAIYAPRHGQPGSTSSPRALDNKPKELAALQPPKAPIKPVCLSNKPSRKIDATSYAATPPPTLSDSRSETQPKVSSTESCPIGPYPGTISRSLRRIKWNPDFSGADYNRLPASPGMPTKIDIDPFFTTRAQSLELRYENLTIRPKFQQPPNTENGILESIDQNVSRMSRNFNISVDRCSESGGPCCSNATTPSSSLPRGSCINAEFIGHECGMFIQNDEVDDVNACLDEKVAVGASLKKGEATPSRENVICDEKPDISPEISLCETLSASPLIAPKRKNPLSSSKERRVMKSVIRNSSLGSFHINFPNTEFGEAYNETYQSKSDAIGSLFETVVEYSNYVLFDRGSSTFYPQPKGYVFSPLEEQSKQPKLECIWLPMQFGRFPEMSLNGCVDTRRDDDHQLPDIAECEGDAPAASITQSKAPTSMTSTSSNNSLLDLYFATLEDDRQEADASKRKQPEATPDTALPAPLTTPLGEPARPSKLNRLWDEIDDEVITEPLNSHCSAWKTKTWADLGIEFIDKYAPNKNADNQKRAVDAARNFLKAQGKYTSDYDPVTRPQRKAWSRDRDGSDDVSFLYVEDLARYETLRAEYRRHMALDFEMSSSNSTADALAEINYVPMIREVSRESSRDSGYADTEATLTEPYLASHENLTTIESVTTSSQSSSSELIEESIDFNAAREVSFSPCNSSGPSLGEELAQSPILELTGDVRGSTTARIARTYRVEKFELEDPIDTQVGNESTTGNVGIEGLKTPRRALLHGGRSNLTPQGRMNQNKPGSQVQAAYYGPTGEPLHKRKLDEEDEKENEERNWSDIMLYG